MTKTSQSEQSWHSAWIPCHGTTPLSSMNHLQQEFCACKASLVTFVPVTRLLLHLCASPSSYFNTYHMAAHSFPALHALTSFSSLPGSLVTANPVSSSIQPAFQTCNSVNRLKFLAPHLSQLISNFAPIAPLLCVFLLLLSHHTSAARQIALLVYCNLKDNPSTLKSKVG